jgi:hypothetical protein
MLICFGPNDHMICMSSRAQKIAFVVFGAIPLLMGILLFGTAGIKGFNGTGGEDAMLFQLVGYACIIAAAGGLLSILTALKLSRLMGLVAGILMILPGLFIFLVNPIYGLPILVMGILAVIMSRRIVK